MLDYKHDGHPSLPRSALGGRGLRPHRKLGQEVERRPE